MKPLQLTFVTMLFGATSAACISSVSVLKDANATREYGLDGRNGVIVVNIIQENLNQLPESIRTRLQ